MTNEPGEAQTPPAEPDAANSSTVVETQEESPASTRADTVRANVIGRLRNPFLAGFLVTLGVLLAYWLGGAISSLSGVMISIGIALFISLALEPLVHWLEEHKMSRALAIAVVVAALALVFGIILAVIIPIAVDQIGQFAKAAPTYVQEIQHSSWLQRIIEISGQPQLFDDLFKQARDWLSNPSNLATIGGGAVAVGSGMVNVLATTLIVLVLTLYFVAALPSMKKALVQLAPAYSRPRVGRLVSQLSGAVGGYVSGMAILAVCNAVFSLILLLVLRVPFAALLAFLALFITMIPMVGSVMFWLLASVVSLLTVGWMGLVFMGVYFAYMQVEAYVMTPKAMSKAVSIPGSLVLIGAMVGATLLGLLGALVAVPVTASLLTIINEIFIPRQDAKLVREE